MPPGDKNLQRWDQWFITRKWRVLTELSGTQEDDGIKVVFDHGSFDIDPPGAFQSVMGPNLGRHGVLLQEIDPATGKDIEGALVAFGHVVVEKARKELHAIA
jgi:hypothetical protein